ncbi:helix-turn-helix domain-containing protein [Dactylosporangium darangshiense]|uniref:HTH luxR-type domain-containing protein n=1 Tax=Dactylosporangium darangshiense TaxID=579108 RepID=A0ABP8D5J8_9ACTN
MPDETDQLDAQLLDLGEQHAYRLLVRLAAAGPDDLADTADIPAAEARRLLESLRAKGLARGGPVFEPLPPDVALGDALLRRQRSLDSARRVVARLTEEYRATTRRRVADHLVEIVVGAAALRERLRDMQNSAQEEILWFCRVNPIAMSGPENAEESAALGRGVRYRAIYERALVESPGELPSIAASVRRGEQARVVESLPVRLAIADRSIAICPLVPDRERDLGEPTAALIRRSELLDALVALFEGIWDRASPLLADEPDGGPAEAERLLLSLLVAGFPDKSIASQLGVSKRTVQRRLERLMVAVGVDTRTGLAFEAGRRGWLPTVVAAPDAFGPGAARETIGVEAGSVARDPARKAPGTVAAPRESTGVEPGPVVRDPARELRGTVAAARETHAVEAGPVARELVREGPGAGPAARVPAVAVGQPASAALEPGGGCAPPNPGPRAEGGPRDAAEVEG